MNKLDEPIIEKFRITKINFFGCRSLVQIFMKLSKDSLILAYDQQFKNVYLYIKFENILCVNKNQIDKYDVNKLSIHYKCGNSVGNKVKEVKLKTNSRRETDIWIHRLKIIIQPERYTFVDTKTGKGIDTLNSLLTKGEVVKGRKLETKVGVKELFINLSLLEYFIQRKNKLWFFKRLVNYTYAKNEYSYHNRSFENYKSDGCVASNSFLKSIDEIDNIAHYIEKVDEIGVVDYKSKSIGIYKEEEISLKLNREEEQLSTNTSTNKRLSS